MQLNSSYNDGGNAVFNTLPHWYMVYNILIQYWIMLNILSVWFLTSVGNVVKLSKTRVLTLLQTLDQIQLGEKLNFVLDSHLTNSIPQMTAAFLIFLYDRYFPCQHQRRAQHLCMKSDRWYLIYCFGTIRLNYMHIINLFIVAFLQNHISHDPFWQSSDGRWRIVVKKRPVVCATGQQHAPRGFQPMLI